jgi:Protein of unknown function (DUF2488)
MKTYYFVLASQRFLLEEEPFEEVLKERVRNYQEQNREIALVRQTTCFFGSTRIC